MVNGIKWLARRLGNRLTRHQPHDQPADQSRTGSGGNGINIGKCDASLAERFFDQRVERLDMGAGGDFGTTPP